MSQKSVTPPVILFLVIAVSELTENGVQLNNSYKPLEKSLARIPENAMKNISCLQMNVRRVSNRGCYSFLAHPVYCKCMYIYVHPGISVNTAKYFFHGEFFRLIFT